MTTENVNIQDEKKKLDGYLSLLQNLQSSQVTYAQQAGIKYLETAINIINNEISSSAVTNIIIEMNVGVLSDHLNNFNENPNNHLDFFLNAVNISAILRNIIISMKNDKNLNEERKFAILPYLKKLKEAFSNIYSKAQLVTLTSDQQKKRDLITDESKGIMTKSSKIKRICEFFFPCFSADPRSEEKKPLTPPTTPKPPKFGTN